MARVILYPRPMPPHLGRSWSALDGKLDIVSISVLRAYVEALGGHLKVTAEFDDSTYLVA